VNAGHNPPLLYKCDGGTGQGELIELQRTGMALGVVEDVHFEEGKVELVPGDFLLLYTDGVTDASNADEQLFGVERLKRTLLEHRRVSARDMLTALEGAIADFVASTPQFDDIAMVLVKRVE
jgi:sigma-B regulation protein RsbU (phosphoserine phosphatase)